MKNTLSRRPDYTEHRVVTGAPIVADTTDLVALNVAKDRQAINAEGYDDLACFVSIVVGTSVTLQPLEAVKYDDNGTPKTRFVPHLSGNIGPLVDGESFKLPVSGGGRWFFRLHSVAGAVTKLQIFIAAGTRANEGSI